MSDVLEFIKIHRAESVAELEAAQRSITELDIAIAALERHLGLVEDKPIVPIFAQTRFKARPYYSKDSQASKAQQRRREREQAERMAK